MSYPFLGIPYKSIGHNPKKEGHPGSRQTLSPMKPRTNQETSTARSSGLRSGKFQGLGLRIEDSGFSVRGLYSVQDLGCTA